MAYNIGKKETKRQSNFATVLNNAKQTDSNKIKNAKSQIKIQCNSFSNVERQEDKTCEETRLSDLQISPSSVILQKMQSNSQQKYSLGKAKMSCNILEGKSCNYVFNKKPLISSVVENQTISNEALIIRKQGIYNTRTTL